MDPIHHLEGLGHPLGLKHFDTQNDNFCPRFGFFWAWVLRGAVGSGCPKLIKFLFCFVFCCGPKKGNSITTRVTLAEFSLLTSLLVAVVKRCDGIQYWNLGIVTF